MSRFRSLFFGLSLVLVAGLLHATTSQSTTSQSKSNSEALQQLESLLDSVKTFEADFVEQVPQPYGRMETYKGHFTMQRPGKFRWSVIAPEKQIIVSDGYDVWLYDVDLQQVSVTPLGERIGDTPALLLSGNNKAISKEYTVEIVKRDGFDKWFQLKNRSAEGFIREVGLGFVDGEVRQMVVLDGTQAPTSVQFKKAQRNHQVANGDFKFMPPEGVDVIGIPTAHD